MIIMTLQSIHLPEYRQFIASLLFSQLLMVIFLLFPPFSQVFLFILNHQECIILLSSGKSCSCSFEPIFDTVLHMFQG